MKRFAYPLDRVLAWRRLESDRERGKLESLHAELAQTRAAIERLTVESEGATRALATATGLTGADLAGLALHGRLSRIRGVQLAADESRLKLSATAQRQRCFDAERAVKLLERLRERRLSEWQKEFDREMERTASELHLARVARDGR